MPRQRDQDIPIAFIYNEKEELQGKIVRVKQKDDDVGRFICPYMGCDKHMAQATTLSSLTRHFKHKHLGPITLFHASRTNTSTSPAKLIEYSTQIR